MGVIYTIVVRGYLGFTLATKVVENLTIEEAQEFAKKVLAEEHGTTALIYEYEHPALIVK